MTCKLNMMITCQHCIALVAEGMPGMAIACMARLRTM